MFHAVPRRVNYLHGILTRQNLAWAVSLNGFRLIDWFPRAPGVTGPVARVRQGNSKSKLMMNLVNTSNGLKEAAELVKDIAPSVLTPADLIAKFIVDL
jgi:hypothetical protein